MNHPPDNPDVDTAPISPLNRRQLAVFRRVLGYIRPYRGWMLFSAAALVLSTGLGLLLPLVVRSLVDVVLIQSDMQLLHRLALGLLAAFLLQAVFGFAHRLSLSYVGERVVAELRVRVFTHLQGLSLRYYADHRTGETVSRLTNDVSLLQEAITSNLIDLLRHLLMLVGSAGLLFYLDWRLTLIILTGIPPVSLIMVFMGRRIRQASTDVQDRLAEAANVVEETTSGVRTVKSFAREDHEIGRFSDRVEATFKAAMRRARISATLGPTIGFLAFASITMTLWFGSYEVIQGRLTAGGLVAYLVYTMMVASPVGALASLYAQLQSSLGATKRLFELLDTQSDVADAPNALALPQAQGRVSFDHVSFAYNDKAPVLHDLSFAVEPGQIIAIVGPSGAGKTTLVNLVPRFYDADNGTICLDGEDVRDLTLKSLRGQIGIVPQETLLFSDTVYENIRYGRLDASTAEIEAAAVAANADAFIRDELPDGYDTLVGERGVKLSGGQRQRVAIARALLKDPRILILDEATSSLDSASERLVQEALARLLKDRTAFVIAHRLSTIVSADRILVLEGGRLVQQGSHAELVQETGLYRRLYQLQFSDSGVHP
jgi:ATP-binding cassette, subfamily B, bacterial MsbA